nr:hypothetical protein CFP56_73948 [Quercus suber]
MGNPSWSGPRGPVTPVPQEAKVHTDHTPGFGIRVLLPSGHDAVQATSGWLFKAVISGVVLTVSSARLPESRAVEPSPS